MKKLFIGSNLKLYKTNLQTLQYLKSLQELTQDISRDLLELFIFPTQLALSDSIGEVDRKYITIGAQNVHWTSEGPYTGEVSARSVKELGIDLVLVGHAERRQVFGDTDQLINKRVTNSLNEGLQVLLCVGDTIQDKELEISEEKLVLQLKTALHGIPESLLEKIWIAYEPVWAIGEGGIVASPEFANSIHQVLRKILVGISQNYGSKIPIIYGGSVNNLNALDLISQPEIDGLFIGRSAWDAENLNKIIRIALSALNL